MRRALVFVVGALFSVQSGAVDFKVPVRSVTSVAIGKHLLLPLPPGVRSATSGDAKIASVQVLSDSEILVTGITRGRTTLTIKGAGRPDTVYELNVQATGLAPQEKPNEMLTLGVGHQKSFTVPDVKRIAVGDPKIADVTVVDGKELLITGVGPGRTSLLVWRGSDLPISYVLKVEEKPLEQTLKEIRELLGPMEGLRLRIIGERIFLDGEVETPEDDVLIKKVCALFPSEMVCL